MSQNGAKEGIFINGREQVVELLRHMDAVEKSKLLRNLRNRNPTLAKELSEQCFSYDSVWALDDENLSIVLSNVKPVILGLALALSSLKSQKRALALIPRDQALKAYEVMTKDLTSNRRDCVRAQEKILEIALDLSRRRQVQFY
jgi:flagellar motor switch protein FliG